MPFSIKVWNLADPLVKRAIAKSFCEDESDPERKSAFVPWTQQMPLYSTTQVHHDYIDCVKWLGNLILSKSTKNRIALWAPDSNRYKGAPLILREFLVADCDLW